MKTPAILPTNVFTATGTAITMPVTFKGSQPEEKGSGVFFVLVTEGDRANTGAKGATDEAPS